MVDKQAGVFLQPLHDKIHKRLEGPPLFMSLMRPEVFILCFSILKIVDSEEIFQPAGLQRVPFHVEKEVPFIGFGKTIEPSQPFRIRRKNFKAVFPAMALLSLLPSLTAQFP